MHTIRNIGPHCLISRHHLFYLYFLVGLGYNKKRTGKRAGISPAVADKK